jgi:hypothetical protein
MGSPGTPALTDACAREGHSGLAKTPVPRMRLLVLDRAMRDRPTKIGNKLALKDGIVIIEKFLYGSGEAQIA